MASGNRPTTQAGDCGPIQDMTGMHSLQTNKQTSGEKRPETTSDQGTRPCPHSRRSSDQSWQYTDETQPTTLVQTGAGRDNQKNAEHCSPLIPNGHSAEDVSASMLVTQPDTNNQPLGLQSQFM